MRTYKEDAEILRKYHHEHHIGLITALDLLITEGVDEWKKTDIDKLAEKILENSSISKEFQIEILKWTKEISTKIKRPINLFNYYKEEINLYGPDFKMSYDRLMTIIRNLLEMFLYPDDGGDHMTEFELMDAVGISDKEWKEIWKTN